MFITRNAEIRKNPKKYILDITLEDLDLTSLNPYAKNYAFFDITSGFMKTFGKVKIEGESTDILMEDELKNLDVIAPKQKFEGVKGFFVE